MTHYHSFHFFLFFIAPIFAHSISLKSINLGTDAVTESLNNDFLNWFTSVGGIASGVTVGHDGKYGRGVYATTTIAEDDEVISIPLEWCMCRESAMKDTSRSAKKAYRQIKDDDDLVALMLMREMSKGYSKTREKKAMEKTAKKLNKEISALIPFTDELIDLSKWAPYLRVLPRTVPITIFYNQKELNALEDQEISNAATERRAIYAKQYKSMKKQLKLLFSDISIKSRRSRLVDYLWAKSVTGSRALSMSGKKYLVPLADMFNYKPHADASERKAENGKNFLRYHKIEKKIFYVYADRVADPSNNVFEYTQLMEDYGDNTNEIYINHHG